MNRWHLPKAGTYGLIGAWIFCTAPSLAEQTAPPEEHSEAPQPAPSPWVATEEPGGTETIAASPEQRPVADAAQDAHPDLSHALEEAALDLGIVAHVVTPEQLEGMLAQRPAQETSPWLISYRVTPVNGDFRVEVTAVPPGTLVRRVAVDLVDGRRLEVRAMVLLREAVQVTREVQAPIAPPPPPPPAPRSAGRAVLALNTALLGGAVGVSLHQAGASDDNRLLYPLAALGVGIGLGASMLIADEWDITTDDAWFLSAGMAWPAASGVLLSTSYEVREDYRYLYGLSGTAIGVTLATIVVAQDKVHEGSATLAHSGGAFGLGLGALAEGIVQGDLVSTPLRGMGYGTGIGVLAAGLAATQWEVSSSRVLLVDLSALLGGLTGGAIATPLLLVDDVDDTRRRLWFGSIALGTTTGALLGLLATTGEDGEPTRATSSSTPTLIDRWAPHAGVVGFSEVGARRSPAWGAGLLGLW